MNELRVPPHDLDAEQALLGSCMQDRDVIGDVLAMVPPDDKGVWYGTGHHSIYQALAAAFEAGDPIDAVVLRDRLATMGLLEKVGGVAYLVDLVQSVASSASAEHYARIVRDKAMLRRLIVAAGGIVDSAYAQSEPVAEILDAAERRLLQATEQRATTDAVDVSAGMHEAVANILAGQTQGLGLMSGLQDLDAMTNGFRPGELTIIAARPSVGKSALAANIAEHVGFNLGQRVLFFSLEMTSRELIYRLLCSRAGINGFALRQKKPDAFAIRRLQDAASGAIEDMVAIDETPQLTPLEMRARARRRRGLGMVFVDYLQLMRAPGTESRQQEVAAISRSLRAMAKELAVPVLALAQLNRSSEGRDGHRPRLSDLRESGQIEQDADMVILLHRPCLTSGTAPANLAEAIVAKNRNGPVGLVNLSYQAQYTRFGNWSDAAPAAVPDADETESPF